MKTAVREDDLAWVQASHLHRLRYQVLLSNGHLLLGHIARDVDHLHAVTQWLWDGVGDVCRADEQDLNKEQ
jgi:hypothetical protein